ncbi:MAG: hypothetical protein ABGW69_04085 [Nanoarchaeota archaeon]
MAKNVPKKDPIPEIYYKIGEIIKRLKVLEERVHSFAEKLQSLNNEVIEIKKQLTKYKANTNEEIEKLKKEIGEINSKIRVFERELPRLVRKNEIEVLKKVFSLWDPMNFVTEKEFEFILEDKINELKNKLIKELREQGININNFELTIKKEKNNFFPSENKKENLSFNNNPNNNYNNPIFLNNKKRTNNSLNNSFELRNNERTNGFSSNNLNSNDVVEFNNEIVSKNNIETTQINTYIPKSVEYARENNKEKRIKLSTLSFMKKENNISDNFSTNSNSEGNKKGKEDIKKSDGSFNLSQNLEPVTFLRKPSDEVKFGRGNKENVSKIKIEKEKEEKNNIDINNKNIINSTFSNLSANLTDKLSNLNVINLVNKNPLNDNIEKNKQVQKNKIEKESSYNKEESKKVKLKFSFKHIKIPSIFLNKVRNNSLNHSIEVNSQNSALKEENTDIIKSTRENITRSNENSNNKNTNFKPDNLYLTNNKEFIDLKAIKEKKKEKIEEKFKEKLKKSYEEFKKDWIEFK